jgi:ATP-dependent DNA helicase DinG
VSSCDEFVADLDNRSGDVEALAETVTRLTTADDEEFVYWYEVPPDGSTADVSLYAAPLHVGSRLREVFFPALRSVVTTSATLAVAGKFTYFLDRIGLTGRIGERVRTLAVGSPFDYDKQALVAVPAWFPNPKSPLFQEAVVGLVRSTILRVRRGTLVLFTSYKMLNDTYRAVRDDLSANEILLLGQGLDGSRSSISDIFRAERESVLFGTESFWQGVDMPGEALELLIIVKLPFSVPTEPLLIAQSEELKKNGKDPFLHLTVPEAAIRFRQGFGRLIRTQTDRGAVLILDTRVVTERFGRAFTLSLPTACRAFASLEELLDALESWFTTTG